MVMKFKFKHVLSYDNKQFYKLTSFDCLPASKLPLKYINTSCFTAIVDGSNDNCRKNTSIFEKLTGTYKYKEKE